MPGSTTSGDRWRKQVKVGDVVLICDVGGGTTDFTLIAVGEEAGQLVLTRVAVGDHILLGGDNMDLALAYTMAAGFAARTSSSTWARCSCSATAAGRPRRSCSASQPGQRPRDRRSAAAVEGHRRHDQGRLSREELERVLLDGFFPECPADAVPRQQRAIGFQELGLPYASDPAVTRHLAHFLLAARQRAGGAHQRPAPAVGRAVQRRRLQGASRCGSVWCRGAQRVGPGQRRAGEGAAQRRPRPGGGARGGLLRPGPPRQGRAHSRRHGPGVLRRRRDVAARRAGRAAAAQGAVRRALRHGGRHEVDVPGQEFGLVVGEPAEFRFLGSTVRRDDPVGTLVEEWEGEIEELSPLTTTLEAPGQARPHRAGASAQQGDGGGHAGVVVPQPGWQAAVEAGVQCAG